ncbi:MAG: hypothetical protein LBT86_04170 [Deltaproteobacteria bacterium]|jgi:hypothetical protein|nr:hypothetical protein [Deltaproteobacteria bacterium]
MLKPGFILVGLLLGFILIGLAASARAVLPGTGEMIEDLGRFEIISDRLNNITGLAVSPALVLFASGLYKRATTEDGQEPWLASPWLLFILGVTLAVFFLKDVIPIGAIQKPLAAVEEVSMTLWGALGLLVSTPLWSSVKPMIEKTVVFLWPLSSSLAQAADPSTTLEPSGGGFFATLAGAVIYGVVWCVSNTINIMCLVAPSLVAPILKGFRLALVGTLMGLSAIHPLLGLVAAILVIIVSLILFRWAFKLTVWGFIFTFDLLFRRWRREPDLARIQAFVGSLGAKKWKIPKRSLGYLQFNNNVLTFAYRPFLFLRKTITIPGTPTLGRQLLWPTLLLPNDQGQPRPAFAFRLALKGHEDALAKTLGVSQVADHGLRRRVVSTWRWIKGFVRPDEEELGEMI